MGSHPAGLQKFAALPFATYRVGYPWNPEGEDQHELPAAVRQRMERKFLKVRVVENSEAAWGTGGRLMVESAFVGVPRDTEFGSKPSLEVLELVEPHMTSVWTQAKWEAGPIATWAN